MDINIWEKIPNPEGDCSICKHCFYDGLCGICMNPKMNNLIMFLPTNNVCALWEKSEEIRKGSDDE